MWCRGVHKVDDVIPTSLARKRPTIGGGTRFPYVMPFSYFAAVGRADRTLLGGLK